MLTLQIIRHAKTSQNSETGRDFDRALMPKGISQANLLGHYLKQEQLNLGTILLSGARRTKQTFSILEQQGVSFETKIVDDTLYLASSFELLAHLHEQTSSTITLIGHNDGLSELASYLLDDYEHLKTCAFIQLHVELNHWAELIQGTAVLAKRFRPEVYVPLV